MSEQNHQPDPTPAGEAELLSPRLPEPDISESDIEELIDPVEGVNREDLELHTEPFAEGPFAFKIRDDRIAYLAAIGMGTVAIAKKIGSIPTTVSGRLRKTDVAKRVISYRREIVEKAKGFLLRNLNSALRRQEEHFDLEDPVDPKQRAFLLRKKKHELEAIKFAVEQGMLFIQQDHALGKLEEHFFGTKTPTGPLVQINQTAEQPSQETLAVEKVLLAVPERFRREVILNLHQQRLIEATPVDTEAS